MYVHIVYVRIYIYRYVPIVGGIGGPLRDKFWADFGAKKLGQKNSDHYSSHSDSTLIKVTFHVDSPVPMSQSPDLSHYRV